MRFPLDLVLQGVALDRRSTLWPGSWQHTILTVDIGMNFPTGSYDRLSRAQDGSGSGIYSFRYGLIDQTGFKLRHIRPFRVRLWATGIQPVTSDRASMEQAQDFLAVPMPKPSAISGVLSNFP